MVATLKPDYPNERDCEHGSMRRKCEICERDEEIARLAAEVERLRSELAAGAKVTAQQTDLARQAEMERDAAQADYVGLKTAYTVVRGRSDTVDADMALGREVEDMSQRIALYAASSKHDEEMIDKLTAERDELRDGNDGARVYCEQLEEKLAAAEAAMEQAHTRLTVLCSETPMNAKVRGVLSDVKCMLAPGGER